METKSSVLCQGEGERESAFEYCQVIKKTTAVVLKHWLCIFQTSMSVRSERTTVADMLYAPTRRGASSAAAARGGLETASSAQVNWKNNGGCIHELCGLEARKYSFYKVKFNFNFISV